MRTEADLEQLIRGVVAQVVGTDGFSGNGRAPATPATVGTPPRDTATAPRDPRAARTRPVDSRPDRQGVLQVNATGGNGLFADVGDAVAAARTAQERLQNDGIEKRRAYVEAIRAAGVASAEALGRSAYEETGLGRFRDKVEKNVFAATRTAGVEDLEPTAFAGDHGLAVEDYLPWGVVASITPINSPSAFIINHAITMVAGGNACVFNVHPGCRHTSMATVRILNQAITTAGGPDNLLTGVVEPTLDSAKALVGHPGVDMLVITGGAALLQEAMATRKRVIAAGPGVPTAVVDETADLRRAAREVFRGASYENTILCIGEKTCIVTDRAAPEFLAALESLPVRRLDGREIERVFHTVMDTSGGHQERRPEGVEVGHRHQPTVRREFVGKDAEVLLRAAGLSASRPVGLLVAEVERDHPLVRMEQFVPLLPVVRARDAEDAIDLAVEVEGGNHHTVMIHSNWPPHVERFAREADCVLCVVNGSSLRGLGVEGEGYPGFTIGTVTGEGITSTRHYVKARRVSYTR